MADPNSKKPVLPTPLHVGKPNIGNRQRFIERLEGIFDRGWLTNAGPLEQEFEQRLAEYLGVKHCRALPQYQRHRWERRPRRD